MRNQLPFMNESGFYLPYVLMVAVISLTILTTTIYLYKNEIETTHYVTEQIKAETLIQMGRVQFKKEKLYKINDHGQVTYEFPNGIVSIHFTRQDETVFDLQFSAETTNEFLFEIASTIDLRD